jgi:4'-phosphopantetheinyl transferase
LWSFSLDRSPAELRSLTSLLADDERERVAGFRFEHDRVHAIAARSLLRVILGRYVGRAPECLSFEYGPHGKPSLRAERLHFNLSHSGGHALCGIALDRPLGVDIERIRGDLDFAGMARHSFSAYEQATLASYPREYSVQAFFRCWTSKEAYIKARGAGLAIPLDSFDVPLTRTPADAAVRSRETVPDADGWFIREIRLDPTLAAALATQSRECRVRTWRWPDPDTYAMP